MSNYSLVPFLKGPIYTHDSYVEDVITVKLKNDIEILVTCGVDMEIKYYDLKKKILSRYMGVEKYYSLLQLNDDFFVAGRRTKFRTGMRTIRSLCKVNNRRFLAGDELGYIYMYKFHPTDQPRSPVSRRLSDTMEMIRDLPISRFCRFESHEERVVSLLKKGNFFFSAGGFAVDYGIRKWKLFETEEEEDRRRSSSVEEAKKENDLRSPAITFPGKHSHRIMELSFLDEAETKIVSCSNDDEMVIWDLKGTPLQKIVTKSHATLCLLRIDGKERAKKALFLAGTTKGSLILTYLENEPQKSVVVLPTSTKYEEEKENYHGNYVRKIVSITVGGRKVYISTSDDGKIQSWRIRDSREEGFGSIGNFGSRLREGNESFGNLKEKVKKKKLEFSEMKKRYEMALMLKRTINMKRCTFLEKLDVLNKKMKMFNDIVMEEMMGDCTNEEDEEI